ncbi:MAG: DNA-processing protein DprA, partial [Chloroflexota bacterium]|nr:DNA-processing protein DprA [Chloroflexota bacterium]
MSDETSYYVGLSMVAGIGPVRMRLLLDHFGSVENAWHATRGDLLATGLEARTVEALCEMRLRNDLAAVMERLDALGVKVLTWESDNYPDRLREVEGSPPVLYVLGEITPADGWAVAVVGTRRATPYGREATARLTAGLAQAGVTV